VNLNGADLTRAIFQHTVLAEIDLSRTKGLESVLHVGPSTIGIDTIYSSNGMIPEVFLRGLGVPEPLISQMKALGVRWSLFNSISLHQLFEQRP
jgi:hypothetical protein